MGMCASYIAISDADDDQIFNLYQDEQLELIVEELEELEEYNELNGILTKDIMWDSLHYLFTKSSLYYPIDDNHFSFAFAGENILDLFETEHIGINSSSLVNTISRVLQQTDIDYYLSILNDFEEFDEEKIYPEIWDRDINELKEYLRTSFLKIRDFYQQASDKNMNVVVYIRDKS